MSTSVLEISKVSKSFGGVSALKDVSLSLRLGEIHCLAGQNGSGKSTLIKIISGVYQPDAGVVSVNGNPTSSTSPRNAISAGVQVIYQDFSLFGNLSVAENLALPSLLTNRRSVVTRHEMREVSERALASLGIELPVDREVCELPVAGKQLVAIARALMSAPRLLIMDEPTAALTGQEVSALFRVLRDVRANGVSILFVSHKMREMFEISDRVTVLRNGQVVASGDMAEFDESAITEAMTGDQAQAEHYMPNLLAGSIPRLEARNLSTSGVHGVDLTLAPGEIVGLAGLLGSGRTELAQAIFGMVPEYHGELRVDGQAVEIRSIQAAVDSGIAYVPEDRLSEGLFLTQSIFSNAASAEIGTSKKVGVNWSRLRERADGALRSLGVSAASDRAVDELSGGNQQRVVLARWLLTKPNILLLNGPTSGVDVGAKADLHRLVRRLAVDQGVSVLLISDEPAELVENCNRVLLMHHGRIADEFETSEVSEEEIAAKLRALS